MEPNINKQEKGLAPLVGWSTSPNSSPIIISNGNLGATSPRERKPQPIQEHKSKTNGKTETSNLLEVKFENMDKDSIISSTYTISDDGGKNKRPKIPDGGWGWMVVLSSLVISMVADGISFSFGLLYIEFLHHFGASKSVTSWIGSLFMAVPLLTGPVMSALVDHYGCRLMTIVGGIVSALGFILSFFVNTITLMYLTFGVIAGLGLGLCYVTAVVSVAYWFDKKRTLATGLGACGTGIGTFVYAPMTQYFISEFGWRGTVLLLAGTFLNMCVCGAVMRDPDWLIWEERRKASSSGKRSIKNASSTGSISGRSVSESDFPGVKEIRKLMKSGEKPEYILQNLVTSMDATSASNDQNEKPLNRERFRSVVNLPTFIKQSETVPLEVLEQLSANKKLYNVILENYPSLLLCRSTSDRNLNKIDQDASVVTDRVPVRMSMKLKKANKVSSPPKSGEEKEVERPLIVVNSKPPPLTRADSLILLRTSGLNPHHYLKNLKIHKHSAMYRGAMLNIPKYRLRASSCPDIYRNSMTTLARENEEKWYADLIDILKGIVDFSLFLELHFLLLSISTILLFTWFIVPYFYLAEHLTRNAYTENDGSFVISIIGVTNTIGMIGLGWAGDQPWLHLTKTYSVCLILCGISCIGLMIFTSNFIMLCISGACFGLFFSSNYSFTPAILVELISIDNFTNAYGLILLCQGIGNLLGPPVAGLLFDITGTWEQSFWQAGIWIAVAGVFIGTIPFTNNKRWWPLWSNNNNKSSISDKASIA